MSAAAIVTATTACTYQSEPIADPTSTTTTAPAPTTSAPGKNTDPGDTTEVTSNTGELDGPTDLGPDDPGPGDEEAAAEHARKTVIVMLEKNKDTKQWWADLAPYLTPAAQEVWKWTDPRRIPEATVNGVEITALSAIDAEATVNTTLGNYALVLYREKPKDPWLTSSIETPQEVQ